MKVLKTPIKDLLIISPDVHGDHRGWFMESYNLNDFKRFGLAYNFIQDNHSFTAVKGTLRGLHFQKNTKAQTKLVRCTKGLIFDVAVDIRKGSPTYGKWFGLDLSSENKFGLLIPKGFAHGFLTLTDNVEVQYKVDEAYSPQHDKGIIWNDSEIGIDWPINTSPILSDKDQSAPSLSEVENNFRWDINENLSNRL